MEIIVETEYGKISINKETKRAYFHIWDYIAPIGDDGVFKGWYGEIFRVCWGTAVIIEKNNWKWVGRAE